MGSVFIEDPSGNTWFMDGAGNIEVTAPKTFSVNATDINLLATKNISIDAGFNIVESAKVNKSTSVGKMHDVFVGGDNMLNVTGNFIELIEGNLESHTEKETEN